MKAEDEQSPSTVIFSDMIQVLFHLGGLEQAEAASG